MTYYETISTESTPSNNKEAIQEEEQQQQATRSFLNSLDRNTVVIGILCFLSGAACMNFWSSSTTTSTIPGSSMMEGAASLEGVVGTTRSTHQCGLCMYDNEHHHTREFCDSDDNCFTGCESCKWHGGYGAVSPFNDDDDNDGFVTPPPLP